MPVGLAYGPLLNVLKDEIEPAFKELEVYTAEMPPADYGLDTEIESILRAAESASFSDFHLVGYSAGGACSLAFTARYPARVRSLALIEPAWIGNEGLSPEAAAQWREIEAMMALPLDELMPAFLRWQMRPGLAPTAIPLPPGPPPPWLAKRPAGLQALVGAFKSYALDREAFRSFGGPVYFALGGLSTPYYEHIAQTLAGVFTDFQVELYADRSHLDPPHRAEPDRFARALREVWARAEPAIRI